MMLERAIECLSKVIYPSIKTNEENLRKALFNVRQSSTMELNAFLKNDALKQNLVRISKIYENVAVSKVLKELEAFYELEIELAFRQTLIDSKAYFVIFDENDETKTLINLLLRHFENANLHKTERFGKPEIKECVAKKLGSNALQHNALILAPFVAGSECGFEETVLKLIIRKWRLITPERKDRMLIALYYYTVSQYDVCYGTGRFEHRIVKLNGIEEMLDEFIQHLPSDIPSTFSKDTFSFFASVTIALFAQVEAFETENFRSSHPSFRLFSFTRQWLESILQQVAQKLNEQEFSLHTKEQPSEEEESSGNQFKQELQPSTCCAQNPDSSQSNLADCEHKADMPSSFNIEKEIKSVTMLFYPFQLLCYYNTKSFLPFLLNNSEDLKSLLLFPERVAVLKQQRFTKTFMGNSSSSQIFSPLNKSIEKDTFYMEQFSLSLFLQVSRVEIMELCRELFSRKNVLSVARLVCPAAEALPLQKQKQEEEDDDEHNETSASFSSGSIALTQPASSLREMLLQFPELTPIGALKSIISVLVSFASGERYSSTLFQFTLIALRFALEAVMKEDKEDEEEDEEEKDENEEAKEESDFDFETFKAKAQLGKDMPICSVLNGKVHSIDSFYLKKLKSDGYSFYALKLSIISSLVDQMEEEGVDDIVNSFQLEWDEDVEDNADPFQGTDFSDIRDMLDQAMYFKRSIHK
ncbi:uncharacterized protein MONOS_3087 [Monocercomonoides exilis]|uniref:uncharacterized protein n=1 Tax=Monocercomonoides exilis TaxID=2049356 RepID=UPI00355A9BEF|nr:hypothetical protein MONOS_3087 [Monocercomonoides exilis]|eukprot:MONOS_3087.1-p1 / transcript=MONOS_3087.1 / gene=MONOS_3087 / organism=Monocercomonoides_exilis_PA203 / gene_product=unspecified product / transcript_product=unspecified product / location=Mono_scaffold00069:58390-60811(+) / protein_length=699 / sequence_SO=supercontig / SO=protein_coding / is_pseudo=false